MKLFHKWDVYKSTNWGNSFKWVLRFDGEVIDNFKTKKDAVAFAEKYRLSGPPLIKGANS